MTMISGDGYGSSHDWIGVTPQENSKRTFYHCVCGVSFTHHYDAEPDVFRAIEAAGMPDVCPKNAEVSR